MKNAQIYDFTLTAGGSFSLNVEGENVRIMGSTGPVEIVTEAYRIGPVSAGQGQGNSPFKRLTINDKSGAGNVGSILIASSDFIDQRISGEVSIIDGEKFRVIGASVFSAAPAITAINYPTVQLWNPAGSGKNLIVNNVDITAYSTGVILIYPGLVALTNDATATRAASNKIGGTYGVGQVRTQDAASAYAYANGSLAYISLASPPQSIFKKSPVVIPPGFGLNAQGQTSGTTIALSIPYFEEAV